MMCEKPFVNLLTLFNDKNDQTIDYLAACYTNTSKLYVSVEKLLKSYITRDTIEGKSVFIKPNWVKENTADNHPICLRTNDNLLIVVLEFIANLCPKRIMIADAPIQDCNWDKMLCDEFKDAVNYISHKYNLPIIIKDLRKVKSDLKNNRVEIKENNHDDYLIFDMGSQSYLEEITSSENRFRVTNYNPDEMGKVHGKGKHQYCICKDVFDYDVIITMPKIKTHRMAGITNSLKVLVGLNGDKAYLPHHRVGAKEKGGDCYKGYNPLRHLAEYLADFSNRRIGKKSYPLLSKIVPIAWYLSLPGKRRFLNAGWYGNDTIWRTVLDLNHVAVYGNKDGKIHNEPQRKLLTIVDGIIVGQGDGPLRPEPLALGVLAVSDNPYLMDIIAGELMGMNTNYIPLLRAARIILGDSEYNLILNNKPVNILGIRGISVKAQMPAGWVGYDEKDNHKNVN